MVGKEFIKGQPSLRSNYASIRIFESFLKYQKYYEGVIERLDPTWKKNLEALMNSPKEAFKDRGADAVGNYGYPLPLDMEDCIKRSDFQDMELFAKRYDELYPFMVELEKRSTALIEKPKMVFTDREVGMFSLQRFMMGMYPRMGFYSESKKEYITPKMVWWSEKHKKIVDVSDIVKEKGKVFYKKDMSPLEEKPNVISAEDNGIRVHKYILDGSPLVYKQVEVDGKKKYATKNKKVFLVKQHVNRQYKSIRIFVNIGANWGAEMINTGIAAVSVAVFLESLGYSVRITGVQAGYFGRGNLTNHYTQKKNANGYRVAIFDMKGYNETLDLRTALYATADKSCFRVKFFRYILAEQFDYNDSYDASLGQAISVTELKGLILSMMKKKELEYEEDTLYYFIGGTELQTIENAKSEIEKIIMQSEEENYEANQNVKLPSYE